ncbi:MAG: hypothetical protein J6X24_03545, partial [Firmicutes bacterium]|nr:hypothetical protein [Bacillota bacterium]
DKIRDTRQEASIELAQRKLEQSSQQEKNEFNRQWDARLSDEIAAQIKSQIVEGYRSQKSRFVNEKWFPSNFARDQYYRTHPNLHGLQGEALETAYYETRMGEMVDAALQNRNDWNTLNGVLSTPPVTVPASLTSADRKRTPLNVALQKTQELPIVKLTEKSMLLERSKDIPAEEIDRLTEEKLPLPRNDQQLLYGWARDRKKEQLQAQILEERKEKFPETAQAGIENLKEMHAQAQTILQTCRDVLPTEEEKAEPLFDYESEITHDQSLSGQDRRLLREEYKKAQEELKNQQQRDLHPKMQTEADQKFKDQVERDATLRLGMSEDEKRQERIKVLNEQNEARRRRRIFQKDWNARLRKAREDKRKSVDEAKDKKVEGKLQAAGDAVGALRGKLFAGPFGEGALGDAYKQLDDAFTGSDLEEGKKYREKIGIEPEKRPVVNPVPKQAAENKIHDEDLDPDLESEDSGEYGPREQYSVVEDDRFVQVDYGEHPVELVEAERVKKEEQKKVYLCQKEDMNAEKEEEPKIEEEIAEDPEEEDSRKAYSVDALAGHNHSEAEKDSRGNTVVDMFGVKPQQVVEEYKGNKTQLWNSVKNDPNLSKQDRDWRLSTMIAVEVLSKRVLEDNNGGYLNNENIEAEAEKIRGSRAYGLLFDKGAPDYLQEAVPDKMLAAYEANVKKIASFEIPRNQQKELGSRLDPVVSSLESTGSGKIIRYVPRGPLGNSTAYENALAAISTVKRNAGKLTADEVYRNTETVLKYLDKKETVRKRAFGRQRWTDCMTFLKQTMPPEKFKEYCRYINVKRGVSDDPAHADYVSPETFGSTNYKEAYDEILDQIKRGKGRPEDYATLIALRDQNPQQPVDKKQLTLKKEEIMNDGAFQLLNLPDNKEALHKYAVEDQRRDYKAWAEKIQENAEAEKANPVLS